MTENVGFMSYARLDDDGDEEGSRLSRFLKALSSEVERQTATPFVIFRDRDDLHWGDDWQARIMESLERSTFFIPLITPNYFESPACRRELEQFLARERALNRTGLVLPIYYETFDLLYDPLRQASDPLVRAIAGRQLDDWRELRHEPLTTPTIQRRISRLAQEVAALLPSASAAVASTRVLGHLRRDRTGSRRTSSSTRTESSLLIVGDTSRAQFRSLAKAVGEATPGMRILVLPGTYREGVVIDRPLEIIGEGQDPGSVRLEVRGADPVVFATAMGRIANLTIRQLSGDGDYFGIDIAQGRLDLEDCDILSESLSGVLVRGGADPRLRRNLIHGSKQHGIVVMEGSFGTFEHNRIEGNTRVGVVIREGSDPVFRGNEIHGNEEQGFYVHEASAGTLEDNEIHANAFPGISLLQGSETTVRRNRIHSGRQHGIYVSEQASGTIVGNDIYGNKYPGLVILKGSDPVATDNFIHHNRDHGIWVDEDGRGRLEGNRITENRNSGVYVLGGGDPLFLRNTISGNREHGLQILDHGRGTFRENDITANTRGGLLVSADSEPELTDNRVHDNMGFEIEHEPPE